MIEVIVGLIRVDFNKLGVKLKIIISDVKIIGEISMFIGVLCGFFFSFLGWYLFVKVLKIKIIL